MDFPKKQAQRLMPLYLLEYSEKLFTNHPDPSAPWGGGSDYTAGQGITITNNEISVDTNVIATKSDLPTKTSELTNDSNFISSSLDNRKTYSKYESSPLTGSWKRVTYDTNGILIETNDSTHMLGFPIGKEGEIAVTSDIPDFSNYYYINNEIQNGEFITKINGNGLEYSKQWTPNSISITADCREMGFDNKPGVVIKTDTNKKVVVSDSIAVYNNEHNSVTGIDGDMVVVSSGDGRYTRLENGKLTLDDGQVREFNLPTSKGQGTYTLATTDDIPSLDGYATETWVQNQGFISNIDLSNYPEIVDVTNGFPDETKTAEILANPSKYILHGTTTHNGFAYHIFASYAGNVTTNGHTWMQVIRVPAGSGYTGYTLQPYAFCYEPGGKWTGPIIYLWKISYGNIYNTPTLATVATTGNYNDLTDKPSIPNTATSTSTSTVTPETGTFVTGTSTNTADVVNSVTYTPSSETLTFTYADNTTASFTFLTSSTTVTSGTTSVVTSVTDSTSNAMTGATVSTSTTTTLS